MKKIFVLLLAAFTVSVAANAQGGGGRGQQDPAAVKQMLKDSIQVDDKKAEAVWAIMQEFQPKQREIAMDQNMTREEKGAKIKELMDARNAKLKAALSEAEYKRYIDMEERRRQQRGQGRPGGN